MKKTKSQNNNYPDDLFIITEVQRISDSKIIKIGDEIENFGIVTGLKIDKNFVGGMKVLLNKDGAMSIMFV